MKTPQEYLREGLGNYPIRDIIDNLTEEELLGIMCDIQKDAYNQALDDISKYDDNKYLIKPLEPFILRETILKLKLK